jgi:hypothetical protein
MIKNADHSAFLIFQNPFSPPNFNYEKVILREYGWACPAF